MFMQRQPGRKRAALISQSVARCTQTGSQYIRSRFNASQALAAAGHCPANRSVALPALTPPVMMMLQRPPFAIARLTSGDAAEKSRAAWPPRLAQVRIIVTSASSLGATGATPTRSPVPYVTQT